MHLRTRQVCAKFSFVCDIAKLNKNFSEFLGRFNSISGVFALNRSQEEIGGQLCWTFSCRNWGSHWRYSSSKYSVLFFQTSRRCPRLVTWNKQSYYLLGFEIWSSGQKKTNCEKKTLTSSSIKASSNRWVRFWRCAQDFNTVDGDARSFSAYGANSGQMEPSRKNFAKCL